MNTKVLLLIVAVQPPALGDLGNDDMDTVRDVAPIAGDFNGAAVLTETQGHDFADLNGDGAINRKPRDFSTTKFQLFDFMAIGMERISLHLDRKFKLEKRLRSLAAALHQRSGLERCGNR